MADYDRALLVRETTFSTKPALTNAEWLEYLTESIQSRSATDMQQGSYYDAPTQEGLGRYSWSGSITQKLGPESGITRILRNFFGAATSTQDGATARWKHVFTSPGALGYTDSVSLGLTRTTAAGIKQWDYVGGAVSRWGLEAVVDQDVRLTHEYIGDKDSLVSVDAAPATLDPREFFNHTDAAFQIGASPTTDADVEAMSVSFESDAMIVPALNSRYGRRVFRGGLSITGRVDRDFVDTIYVSRAYGDAEGAATAPQTTLEANNVVLNFVGETLGGTGDYTNYALKLEFPRVKIFESTHNLSGRDRITQGVPFVVLRDPSVAYAARVTLVNQRAGTFL